MIIGNQIALVDSIQYSFWGNYPESKASLLSTRTIERLRAVAAKSWVPKAACVGSCGNRVTLLKSCSILSIEQINEHEHLGSARITSIVSERSPKESVLHICAKRASFLFATDRAAYPMHRRPELLLVRNQLSRNL